MKRVLASILMASVALGTSYALVKRLATDHAHTDAELNLPPVAKYTPGHSGGLDRNGGHYDRSNGTYHYHR